jgi:hypothetical protein
MALQSAGGAAIADDDPASAAKAATPSPVDRARMVLVTDLSVMMFSCFQTRWTGLADVRPRIPLQSPAFEHTPISLPER